MPIFVPRPDMRRAATRAEALAALTAGIAAAHARVAVGGIPSSVANAASESVRNAVNPADVRPSTLTPVADYLHGALLHGLLAGSTVTAIVDGIEERAPLPAA